MKLFKVDVFIKYILFKLDGEEYLIQFRSSLRKGIHDVSVWKGGNEEKNAKITGAYPPLRQIIYEFWRIIIPVWFKSKIREIRRLQKEK